LCMLFKEFIFLAETATDTLRNLIRVRKTRSESSRLIQSFDHHHEIHPPS
jgi:hypothetical protein